ncbi:MULTISPECIES: class I SAM-dependent methyltransferase [Vibrio]|uniref:class I SAM-dependent methyltransferase n=1 Tax=Vibrio TaxID=662 RepID=UPI00148D796C|nr:MULTISPECIES: class I SAM-dependent methyltransferase [Vibrio]MCM5509994.1 class I SAM-dependent methyltransferase [Vibrio sp. SCSIO 43169]NOI30415.1 class I SAM-dependent methyltransferase [Vibrio coralliilyticus]NOI50003.1 class I SAM-dependent methyltransferase [Vibrio coralliilyticus]NRF32218.1 class I SAM-dependent methyltransferase [Vibrio coralliilyticus]NRF53287.1 class I SAM-dependent methyltransferase [Vibrio coralliilyticus]
MDYLDINKKTWNQRTKIHVDSNFYDIESFMNGQSSLNAVELEQVGDVEGKSLLHLQCHFGQDTLSWARLGAKVTGVDLSGEAIDQAKSLAHALGLEASFVESDVIQFGQHNHQKFDIVFSSYGVLSWLPDLTQWAQMIAGALKAGGEFHLVEFHPFNDLLGGYSYFPKQEPEIEQEGTYTENCDGTESTTVTWSHSLGEILAALLDAGLIINTFSEHPFSPYNCFDGLEYVPNEGYQFLHQNQQVPMLFSIKATKG